jgi:hypothetical protein
VASFDKLKAWRCDVVKAIPYRDVRPGDVVECANNETYAVARIENGPPVIPKFLILWLENGLMVTGYPDQLIGLVSRPGTREERDAAYRRVAELLQQTTWRTSPFGGVVNSTKFPELLRALQEYELLKPEASVPLGVSSDPVEAAIDASCGYLGGGPVGC